MSFGTPVVASAVGGIPDVIQHERTGLLVPQKDPDALADAILGLIQDPPLARSLSDRGLEHARDYFDWGRITDRVVDVYRASCCPRQAGGMADIPRPSPPGARHIPSGRVGGRAFPATPARKLALRALLSIAMLALLFRQVGWAP